VRGGPGGGRVRPGGASGVGAVVRTLRLVTSIPQAGWIAPNPLARLGFREIRTRDPHCVALPEIASVVLRLGCALVGR
jgi:hypothetical protein